ncbi:MAG TPA: hypothetical protein VN081_04090 [Dongiaceae bacterium]|nr:hypothetical protein [Dongiaceae bacterium]
MVHGKTKRRLIASLVLLAILLVVIGIVAIVQAMNSHKDPYAQSSQTNTSTNAPASSQSTNQTNNSAQNNTTPTTTQPPAPDPSTVSTIDIPPMGITVSYIKGVGAFSYQVQRTGDNRQYVAFSSDALIGTKCTDDTGNFASILESPNDNEKSTVSQTITVDGTTYGLSIASATCTSNADLLAKYQSAFTNAFSLLKKMN